MVHLNMINSDHNDRVNHIKLALIGANTFPPGASLFPEENGNMRFEWENGSFAVFASTLDSGGWLITTSNLSGFGGEDEAFFDTTEEASHFIKIFVDKWGL